MEFDQSEKLSPAIAIPAASYDADNTPAAVSLEGYKAATLLIEVGVGGITFSSSNKVEFKVTHALTLTGDYEAVADGDIVGATVTTGGIIKSLVAAHATPTVSEFGYVGRRAFVKVTADFDGTHGSPTPISAVWVRGMSRVNPVT